jgi:hypothetical protein
MRDVEHMLRADLFGVGCIFHQLVTGEELIKGDSQSELLEKNLKIYPEHEIRKHSLAYSRVSP